jgi:hypothetical protein
MDDGQKTPRGHPDFHSYVKILHVFIFQPLQTDGITDRETKTLALYGLEEPFFQLCCCVMSVFGSGGKLVLVYILMYLEYNIVVVLC